MVQTATLNFAMDAAWPLEDCEFIAIVQSQATKETFNAFKQGTIDLNVGFTASDTTVVKNTPVTFTNSTFGGYIGTPETYEWICPGTDSVVSYMKNPTFIYTAGGSFDVTLVVNRGGQIDTVVKPNYITVAFGVGMEEKGNVNVSVRPNPNNGEFTLELNSGKNIVADVTISNMLGNTVYELKNLNINGQFTRNIKLENAAPGAYFLTLRNGETKIIKQIIVN
jgi:PKD repeat protein